MLNPAEIEKKVNKILLFAFLGAFECQFFNDPNKAK